MNPRIGKSTHNPKAVPFAPGVLQGIMMTMRWIVQDKPERLTLFGSFFFLVEAKGIKLWTKSSAVQKRPLQSLTSEFPALDWDHMTDRRHGELLLDLGITFHPICKEPLVGLWRLEQLKASFGASGFVRGNVHHTCTLGRYGGIQAEMAQERTWQTHICFRNAYNLAYEAVRPNDNCPTFVLDSDAYACNPQFMQECHLAIEMYEGKAKERSYGIRDKYRLSGFAAIEVLGNLKALTERYLKSQPMLWMSSATWFDFLARWFRELQQMQICLRRIEPPNMGVLTGIVCNMIHSITSTPIILDFHVCKHSGMFFLSDLDLKSMPYLPDIQPLDDAEVMKLVSAKTGDCRALFRKIWPMPSSLKEQEMFPIGERPTWQAIVKAITDRPWELMWAWRWDSCLTHLEPVVGKLFTDFTCQMWLFLNTHWLADSSNACNANLPGVLLRGRPQTPFSDRISTFFPLLEDPHHARSPWKPFRVKPGYLWQFHELMKVRDERERFDVNDRLGEIFSNLQSLPTSVATSKKVVGKPWVISKQGKVQFVTNPMFYRILGLAEAGAPIQQRMGPRAIKPIQEFTMDMYRFAGYDELVARQSLYLERRRLQMAREKKSAKTKRSQKPPLARTRAAPSQKDQDNCSMDALSDDHDVFMEELFGPEDGKVSMEDVLGPEDGDISMEDGIQGENGDVDMMSSSGEEEGPFEALVEEEDDSDYDCGTEDEDEMEDED
ncbi:hypothetical protein BS17DRAFT_871358 [Gyrodon lividus]|nr:hypothetical protein BS17DRAFT_871358 [Gyrodon lividus]